MYSSAAGCTEEIASKFKDMIIQTSGQIDFFKINDKNQYKEFLQKDLSNYDNILMGSSILTGKPHKNIRKLIEKLNTFPQEHRKLGFFICCMKACSDEKIKEAKEVYLEPFVKDLSWSLNFKDAFGGKADLSPNSSMNFLVKKIIKKNMLKDTPNLTKVEPKVYDFRDWDQINRSIDQWKSIITT